MTVAMAIVYLVSLAAVNAALLWLFFKTRRWTHRKWGTPA